MKTAYLDSRQGPDIDIEDAILVAVQQGINQAVHISVSSILDVHHIRLYFHCSGPLCKTSACHCRAHFITQSHLLSCLVMGTLHHLRIRS